eukprot:CAMPEP_0198365234 /NCGR_PEP_ID=MMETSP1450-20131203/154070_1 /TAXON_ID=753684 ORGANISM="Madagascaria erythrocladiodes, Strain CCMP3234" /NCGR_SAMPLE_ID=MMETSP1450 /ASSEMBLY_ACC=CAM_ASM_001115 /LENGTH=244 /DNA_ID=CAMNT_0044072681 /DNA_START=267 /DNA_END=1001 /DNA_ORIENTATION=+
MAGDYQCRYSDGKGLVRTDGRKDDGTGSCEMRSIYKTTCGNSYNENNHQRIVRDTCSINGQLDLKDIDCGVMCFPPSWGNLIKMEVDFVSVYNGSYSAKSTADYDLRFVQLMQRISNTVEMKGKAVWPEMDSGTHGYQMDYKVLPDLFMPTFPAKSEVKGQVSGSYETSTDKPLNGLEDYMCAPRKAPYDIFFQISARAARKHSGSLMITSSGTYFTEIRVKYIFDAPEGSTHGDPYVPLVEDR